MTDFGSKKTAVAALKLAVTSDHEEERRLIESFLEKDIRAAAVDYGGEFIGSFGKIIERAVVASKRQGLILPNHTEEGAVAGAAHEALIQLTNKAMGLNVGGKIAIARYKDNVSVAMFMGIGLLHLDEVGIGLGHRVL